jgi:hypothetical protein
VFVVDGVELVHLNLFGVEDQAGMDRLRAECHGLWFEEAAPSSVLVQSSGLSDTAWGLGITSCRLPTYRHPKILTENYPDEEHWTWQRFVVNRYPGTRYFRIPPGELASAEEREEWKRALANRPDMLRRLLEGKPGTLMLGEQVAVGFNAEHHAPMGLRLVPDRTATLWIGQDGGLTPATVIGQRQGNKIHVLAALASEHDGIKQHIKYVVRPWLSEHAPWALESREALRITYDPSMNEDGKGDTDANALSILMSELKGAYLPGAVYWLSRLNPVLDLLGSMDHGEPALLVDPVQARGLVKALDGGWHYPTGVDGKRKTASEDGKTSAAVKNHPHSDFGDAFAYMVGAMHPSRPVRPVHRAVPAKAAFSPFKFARGQR